MFSDRFYRHTVRIVYLLNYVFLSSTYLERFNYTHLGEDSEWTKKYPACGGRFQSPISIVESKVTEVACPDFFFDGFNTPDNESVIQDIWHTFTLRPSKMKSFSLTGGPLKGMYVLDKLEYRFSILYVGDALTLDRGSDHAINGIREEMEQQMYMYKSTYYNLDDAMSFYDGVIVLAVFYKTSERTSDPIFTTIGECMPKLKAYMGTCAFDGPLIFGDLLPERRRDYFLYRGSLTVPPCHEKITWIVFKDMKYVEDSQIKKFYQMNSSVYQKNREYYRKTKSLNNRVVFHNNGICRPPYD